MSKKILTNLDFYGNQILNGVIQVLAVDPSTIQKEGQVYYNSTVKKVKYYNGTEWIVIGGEIDEDVIKETIENKLNDGELVIPTTAITGLDTKLSQLETLKGKDGLVSVLTGGTGRIDEGLLPTEINANKLTGTIPASLIGEGSIQPSKLETGTLEGDKFRNGTIGHEKLQGNIPLSKVQGASDIESNANAYTDRKIAELVGSASTDYDTFKEIEDIIKRNADSLSAISGVVKKYVETVSSVDETNLYVDISHNLNTEDVTVSLYQNRELVLADIQVLNANQIRVTVAEQLQNDLKVVVLG